jgi:hypothetical protein
LLAVCSRCELGQRGGFSLFDVKEAGPAATPRDQRAIMPRENAKPIALSVDSLQAIGRTGAAALLTGFYLNFQVMIQARASIGPVTSTRLDDLDRAE